MKKIFTLLSLAMTTLMAMATDYTDELQVIVNGVSVTQEATISVDQNSDNSYKLSLKNFAFGVGTSTTYVGNIVLDNVEGETSNGVTTLNTVQTITITAGDDATKTWLGPFLGEVPIDMVSEIRGDQLYTVIDIYMASLNQTIKVVFGNGGYQIPNSDFESFHKASVSMGGYASYSDEPDHWHSFMSASGNPVLVYMAGYNPHTFICEDVTRPGTSGTKSVMVTSVDMGIAIANGTITTGRLNTGSTTAASEDNFSWLDMDSTAVDENGDPFYAALNGQPDSLCVWVKFNQGTPNAEHPYATVNAIITDGTYYRDPEISGKSYTNVLAKANNSKIEASDNWQRLSIPFDYASYETNGTEAKAILVTISTNADAGMGSTDTIYVDDLSLIYNCKLASATINGTSIEGLSDGNEFEINVYEPVTDESIELVANGKGAKISKSIESTTDGYNISITVDANDLKSSEQYSIKAKRVNVGVSTVESNGSQEVEAIYNLNGQRVDGMENGSVFIKKYSDGKTVKTIKAQ